MTHPSHSSNTSVIANACAPKSDRAVNRHMLDEVLPKRAADIMQVGVKTLDKTASVYDAVRILAERHITGLPVVEDSRLIGIITEKDILNLIVRAGHQLGAVAGHMTTDVTTFDQSAGMTEVLDCLMKNPFRRVPVLRDGRLAGLISRADLIRVCVESFGPAPGGPRTGSAVLDLTAGELMTSGLLTTTPYAPVVEAMHTLVTHQMTGLPVVDDQLTLVGIITEKDLLTLLHDPCARSCRVGDLMTRDLTTFAPGVPIAEICACLARSRFRRVPVVERGRLVGIISRSDLIMFVLKHPAAIRSASLRD